MPIESCSEPDDEDFEVTMTVNSYSGLAEDATLDATNRHDDNEDTTIIHRHKKAAVTMSTATLNDQGDERFNEMRTRLIGDLIELEANFVSYLTMAVATFSRPLRGFFINQNDYYCLFQNIEKVLFWI